jgi:hypothetical protein
MANDLLIPSIKPASLSKGFWYNWQLIAYLNTNLSKIGRCRSIGIPYFGTRAIKQRKLLVQSLYAAIGRDRSAVTMPLCARSVVSAVAGISLGVRDVAGTTHFVLSCISLTSEMKS